jgi:hypothetical protein
MSDNHKPKTRYEFKNTNFDENYIELHKEKQKSFDTNIINSKILRNTKNPVFEKKRFQNYQVSS